MFRFPPSHGCLPPAGGGGSGFTALLPVAGKSWGRSAGAVSVSCSASLRSTVASHPRAGAVCAAASMKRSAVASHPRAGAVPVSPPSCPWRGSPGVDRRGRPPFHTPLPSTPPTAGTLAPTTGATETIRGGLPSYMPSDSGRKNLNSPRARPRFTTENRCANWVPGRFSDAPVFPRYSQKVT